MSKRWADVSKRWAELPRGIRWLVGGAAALIVIVAIAWALLVPIAYWLAAHDIGQAAAKVRPLRLQHVRDAARGRLLTLGAGVLAAGALLFTARTFTLSREAQVTDRYTKAIDQLGSTKPEVQTGAIYALDRVIRDSPRDHHQVMAVLAAYLRQNSVQAQAEQHPVSDDARRAPADIQAAIRVIGHRDTLPGYRGKADVLNLTGVDLTNTDIDDANLSHAWLHDTNLTGASAPSAKFIGAHLRRANFTHANLTSADLTGADLTGADLTGAKRASEDAPVPGWVRDPHSGLLSRASEHTGHVAD